MPLLWGLFSLSTVVEVGVVAVVGKLGSGALGGMPGWMWPADKMVRGLMFLRPPSMQEMRAHDLHKQKKGGPVALTCDNVMRGDIYAIPGASYVLATVLMILVNSGLLLVTLTPFRLAYEASLSPLPTPRGFNFSPIDAAAALLLLLSVFILTALQRNSYSNEETLGLAGTWTAIISGIIAFGVICTEELSFVTFNLYGALLDFNSHQEGLEQAYADTLPWYYKTALPGYAVSYTLSSLCILLSYGLTAATWRHVRTHYQFADRQESTLATLEENRAKYLLEYKLGKVNVQQGGGGGGTENLENPLKDADVSRYFTAFWLKLVSWMSLLLPFCIVYTYVCGELAVDVRIVRLGLAGGVVCARLWMLRPYLQTYLHRDINENTLQGKSSKQVVETLSDLHFNALKLLARTVILFVAPVGVYGAIIVMQMRLYLADGVLQFPAHSFPDVPPRRLVEHEMTDPKHIAPKACFHSVLTAILFWISASESIFVASCLMYRWASRLLTSYRAGRM